MLLLPGAVHPYNRATMATCTSDVTARVRETNRLTARAAAQTQASFIDVLPLVCRQGRCPAFAGGRTVHANRDHLSVDWVHHVLPAFEALDCHSSAPQRWCPHRQVDR